MKIAFIDVETTGINPQKHSIWQLSTIIEVDGKIKEISDLKMNPKKAIIDPEALTIGGITLDDLKLFEDPSIVSTTFKNMLSKYVNRYDKKDKFFFVGYNAKFDYDFVRAWWTQNIDKWFGSYFWFPYIDIMTIAGLILTEHRHKIKNFKLSTIATYLGIKVQEESLHDAKYDIILTRLVYNKITGGLNGST